MGSPLLGDGDVLRFPRRIESAAPDPPGGGFLSQLRCRSRAGGEGLTQPGTGIIDDGAPTDTIVRSVPLHVEELGSGPGTLAVPDKAGNARAGDGLQAEGEGRRRPGEIAFAYGQDTPLRVGGIGSQDQSGAGGAEEADAAQTAVERVGAAALGEMADTDDGGAGARGGGVQRGHGVANVLIALGIDSGGEIGDEGVEDDERRIETGDHGIEEGEVAREGEGTPGLGAIGNSNKSNDALRIAPGGVDAGADGVEGIVLGGEEEDAAWSTWSFVVAGEGLAAGEAGGQLAEQRALAQPGIAVEEGDRAGGDAARPEPAYGLGGDLAEADGVPEGCAALTLSPNALTPQPLSLCAGRGETWVGRRRRA